MATYTIMQLEESTRRVLKSSMFKVNPYGYRFEQAKVNYSERFKSVTCDCVTFNKDSKGHYNTTVIFYKVEKGVPPELDKNPVRISCSCRAYYFYFSYWNKVLGVHARRPLKAYVRKTPPPPEGLPEKNPEHLAGACKHVLAFANFLNTSDYLLGDVGNFKKVTTNDEENNDDIGKES